MKSGLLTSPDNDMASLSIGLRQSGVALEATLLSSPEVALCDIDQSTFIQPLDIRWAAAGACSCGLLSALRHAHVSLHLLFSIALASARKS